MQIGHVIWFCEDDEGWGGGGGACAVGFIGTLLCGVVLTFFFSGRSGLSCGICTLLIVTSSSSSESSKLTTSLLVLEVDGIGPPIGVNGVVTWAVSA